VNIEGYVREKRKVEQKYRRKFQKKSQAQASSSSASSNGESSDGESENIRPSFNGASILGNICLLVA